MSSHGMQYYKNVFAMAMRVLHTMVRQVRFGCVFCLNSVATSILQLADQLYKGVQH